MPIADSDPRVFFAAERTLLAWLRTGLAIVAIGFLVARFGLFIQLLAMQTPLQAAHGTSSSASWSAGLGIAFVLVGSLAIAIAAVQHGRFVATLTGPDLPPAYSRHIAVVLSFAVAALGLVLALYLLLSGR